MNKQERNAANLLAHAIVNRIDKEGKGVEAIEALGQDNFKTLMDMYREHEKATGQK